MYYTDLMEKILTSESGQRMIQRVTHKYGEGYVALWLFQVMGLSNDDVKTLVDDFKLQVVPQTATWSLPIWENSKGLTVDTSLSAEERRMRIIEKERQRSPMNPARIEQIVSALAGGADVWMDEHAGKNRFNIHIYDIQPSEIIAQIRQKVKTIKQSHKTVDFYFEESLSIPLQLFTGGVTALSEKHQSAQIPTPTDSTVSITRFSGGFAADIVKYQTAQIPKPQSGTANI